MAITDIQTNRAGNVTTVTVTSDLSGTIYYHWYIDGSFIATTQLNVYQFYLENDDQVRIEINDTNDPDYDPIANAPAGYPARRTIYWVRSQDSDVRHYRIEQQKDGGGWASIGEVLHDVNQWAYSLESPRLDDLSEYEWRIIPVDLAGNDGTALALDSEKIVHTPDAPDFTVTFNEGPDTVTFAAA